jgi:hypothetical protein
MSTKGFSKKRFYKDKYSVFGGIFQQLLQDFLFLLPGAKDYYTFETCFKQYTI